MNGQISGVTTSRNSGAWNDPVFIAINQTIVWQHQ